MADNFAFTPGSGGTGAADDIGGVLFPRVKLIVGADGTNDGDVSSANPLPISDAGGSLTVDGTVAVTNAGITSIDGKITACNTGAVVLAAGSAAIGKLAANSGVDIGDVDVTSLPAITGSVSLTPTTSGGLSVANFNTGDGFTALTNSAQAIKAGAGQLYGFDIYNPNVTAVYVMFYNVAAASVTVGTTGALKVICIPAGSAITRSLPNGIAFDTAMSIAAATTGGGNGAPTTALEASVEYK